MKRWLIGLFRVTIILAVSFIIGGPPEPPFDPKAWIVLFLIVVIGAWFVGPKEDKDAKLFW